MATKQRDPGPSVKGKGLCERGGVRRPTTTGRSTHSAATESSVMTSGSCSMAPVIKP